MWLVVCYAACKHRTPFGRSVGRIACWAQVDPSVCVSNLCERRFSYELRSLHVETYATHYENQFPISCASPQRMSPICANSEYSKYVMRALRHMITPSTEQRALIANGVWTIAHISIETHVQRTLTLVHAKCIRHAFSRRCVVGSVERVSSSSSPYSFSRQHLGSALIASTHTLFGSLQQPNQYQQQNNEQSFVEHSCVERSQSRFKQTNLPQAIRNKETSIVLHGNSFATNSKFGLNFAWIRGNRQIGSVASQSLSIAFCFRFNYFPLVWLRSCVSAHFVNRVNQVKRTQPTERVKLWVCARAHVVQRYLWVWCVGCRWLIECGAHE